MDLSDLTPAQRSALATRCREVCVVYEDHPLPAGVEPARGRIGIEIDGTGAVMLHLRRGHTYSGASESVSRLVDGGTIEFRSLDVLLEWLNAAIPNAASVADADMTIETGVSVDDLAGRLVDHVSAQIIDHDEIIRNACTVVARHTMKVDPRGPATMLFLGATGVGKTLLAECLAEALAACTSDNWTSFRVDLNEYSERQRVASLLGAPPGYIGHISVPTFLQHLSDHPHTVIVLDEIDKACDDVIVALMTALDVGRITPASGGASIDLRRCVVVATSNLAADEIDSFAIDNPTADLVTAARSALVDAGVRAEIIGRFDAISPFRPLSEEASAAVVVQVIRAVGREYGVEVVQIDAGVSMLVVDRMPPFDRFGARTISRLADETIGAALVAAQPLDRCDLLLDAQGVVARPLGG